MSFKFAKEYSGISSIKARVVHEEGTRGVIIPFRVGDHHKEAKDHEEDGEEELGDQGRVEPERIVHSLEKHGPKLLEPQDYAFVGHCTLKWWEVEGRWRRK